MSMTETVGETEIQVMDEFEFEFEDTCEFMDCKNEVTHEIICFCWEGRERICASHALFFPLYPKMILTFNHTCQHAPTVAECAILPVE